MFTSFGEERTGFSTIEKLSDRMGNFFFLVPFRSRNRLCHLICGIQWAFLTLTLLFSLVDSKDDMEVDETDIVAVQDGKSSIIMLTRSCYFNPLHNPFYMYIVKLV